MGSRFYIECIISNLRKVGEYAVMAGLDYHFVSEIDHLIATAEANMDYEDEK